MADNRKYYYLKLKESYFDDDAIVLLESMQDGILYSYILLKLYLKSLKHGGRLQLDESIPYTPQMIATITRQQIGTVERAIKIFLQLGLMEQMADGAFYMSNIELLIGQSSTEGERKRRARQANRSALNPGGQMSAHCLDIRPPEIEIELEREKELERELEKGHPAPAALGHYQNVFLSNAELSELQADFPNLWQEYIERLSEYMASTGKTYKSHAATIRRWAKEDRRKGKGGISDYSCKEGESL
nr:phage replisome organizer N-terminal domain-containing protein [uncultured Oscillibacter sp.]